MKKPSTKTKSSCKRAGNQTDSGTHNQQGDSLLAWMPIPPKFMSVRLHEIAVPPNELTGGLQEKFRYISGHSPVLMKSALPYLELMQPVILVQHDAAVGQYQLVGGHRTFQLLLEHRSRSASCRAVIFSELHPQAKEEFQAIDSVILKIIQRPGGTDLAILASELAVNKALKSVACKFMRMSNQADLAKALGVERTTLHNMVVSIRKQMERVTSISQKAGKVHIDLNATDVGDV